MAVDIDRFVAEQNVVRFRNKLLREADPNVQAALRRLLIEEEDKLARDLAQLSQVESEIESWNDRIAKQRSIVSRLEQSERDTRIAGQLLESLVMTLALLERHRRRIMAALDRRP